MSDPKSANPPSPNASSASDEGVEILVRMARTGQIDPWNIDIVQVTDQYLQAVADLQANDLRVTGKTLLFLAILLRMKSDQLAGINYLDPPPDEEFLDPMLDPDFLEDSGQLVFRRQNNIRSLDEVMRRRTSTKQPRIRRVTLNDLIAELKRYEILERKRMLREKLEIVEKRRSMADYSVFTDDDIENLAHDEFLEDTVLEIKAVLEKILVHRQQVSLAELSRQGKIDRVSAFLALLFLSAREEVNLHQTEFYGEVYATLDGQQPARELDSLGLSA